MIYLLLWPLHPVRHPRDEMIRVVGVDRLNEIKPSCDLAGITRFDARRPVAVESIVAGSWDQTAFGGQYVLQYIRFTGSPGQFVHVAFAIQPFAGLHGLGFAVIVQERFAVCAVNFDARKDAIDGGHRIVPPRWREDVIVPGPEGPKVVDASAILNKGVSRASDPQDVSSIGLLTVRLCATVRAIPVTNMSLALL